MLPRSIHANNVETAWVRSKYGRVAESKLDTTYPEIIFSMLTRYVEIEPDRESKNILPRYSTFA